MIHNSHPNVHQTVIPHEIKIWPVYGGASDGIFPYGAQILQSYVSWNQDGFISIPCYVPQALGGDVRGVRRLFLCLPFGVEVDQTYNTFLGIAPFLGAYQLPIIEELQEKIRILQEMIKPVSPVTRKGNAYIKLPPKIERPPNLIEPTQNIDKLLIFEANPRISFPGRPPMPPQGVF